VNTSRFHSGTEGLELVSGELAEQSFGHLAALSYACKW
jgi:hypothetical protein